MSCAALCGHRLCPAASALLSTLLLVAACSGRASPTRNVPDIPVYPGARLTSQSNEPDRDPIDTYTVPDTSESAVLAWYREQMPKYGWEPTTDAFDNVVIYRNQAGCYGFVMATQATNGHDVLLQLSQQRAQTPCAAVTQGTPGSE